MRVLLVSHEASRSGAPRVAALVARQLSGFGHRVEVVCRYAGPLLGELDQAAPTSVEPLPRVRNRLRRTRGLRIVGRFVELLTATVTLLRHRPDLVYVNSAAAAIYVRPALWRNVPVVLHVHESAEVAEPFLVAAWARKHLARVTLVACSPSVHEDLANVAGCHNDHIHLLPSVPDEESARRLAAEATGGLPYEPHEIVVGACGTVERRKGPDLLEQAARRVRRTTGGTRVRFVWIGDRSRPGQEGLEQGEQVVELLGPTSNPYVHLKRFDVLALPSRDDPFPLVVLEAMLLGTPVVAFAVGGVAQQVGAAGLVVPPGDVVAFAEAVSRLVEDEPERLRLGEAARARADAVYSSAAFAAKLRATIQAARSGA